MLGRVRGSNKITPTGLSLELGRRFFMKWFNTSINSKEDDGNLHITFDPRNVEVIMSPTQEDGSLRMTMSFINTGPNAETISHTESHEATERLRSQLDDLFHSYSYSTDETATGEPTTGSESPTSSSEESCDLPPDSAAEGQSGNITASPTRSEFPGSRDTIVTFQTEYGTHSSIVTHELMNQWHEIYIYHYHSALHIDEAYRDAYLKRNCPLPFKIIKIILKHFDYKDELSSQIAKVILNRETGQNFDKTEDVHTVETYTEQDFLGISDSSFEKEG